MSNATVQWVLAFDASCGRCRAISAAVEEACEGRLEVLPLARPDVMRWREQALGTDAPWAPTLVRRSGEKVDAWTGPALGFRLARCLGPWYTLRVLTALGRLHRAPTGASQDQGSGIGRKAFFRLGAGAALGAGLTLVTRTPVFAQTTQVDFYDCSGKADGNYVHPYDCTKFITCVAQQYAYERNCPDCHVNPDNCPTGRLHYHHAENACLWSYEAGCVTDPSAGDTLR